MQIELRFNATDASSNAKTTIGVVPDSHGCVIQSDDFPACIIADLDKNELRVYVEQEHNGNPLLIAAIPRNRS